MVRDNIVEVHDFSQNPGLMVNSPTTQNKKGNNFQKSKTLQSAEKNLSSQLKDIQSRMQEIQQNRSSLQEKQARQSELSQLDMFLSRMNDASNTIGGIQSDNASEAQQRKIYAENALNQESQGLTDELRSLQDYERQLSDQNVNLTAQEEQELGEFQQLQEQQELAMQMNDPNSPLSQQKRQELQALGLSVPENMSAAQIENNRDLMLKRQETMENRAFEDQKFRQQQAIKEMEYQRDLQTEERRRKEDNDTRFKEILVRQGVGMSKQQIKAFRQSTQAIESARDYRANIENILQAEPTPAGDAMLVDQLDKLSNKIQNNIDIKGEDTNFMSQSLFNKIGGMNINLLRERLAGSGGSLTEEERKNIKDLSQVFFQNIDNHIDTLKQGREYLGNLPLPDEAKKLVPNYLGSESLSDDELNELQKEIEAFNSGNRNLSEYKTTQAQEKPAPNNPYKKKTFGDYKKQMGFGNSSTPPKKRTLQDYKRQMMGGG